MKIHSLLYPLMACVLLSCSQGEQSAPPVLASRSADSVKSEWLKPHEALLRVNLESEEATDCLRDLHLTIESGEQECIHTHADQLMTHPFRREYVVHPWEGQCEVAIRATVNDTVFQTRTLVPHLRLDTRTQINLNLYEGRLHLVSMWEEEHTVPSDVDFSAPDTVCIGHYLDDTGKITAGYEATSVALVIETDGRHGKAVALADVGGEWVFSSTGSSTGQVFETLEGRVCEGVLNKRLEADSLGSLFYSSTLPYPTYCAFSQSDGYRLTRLLQGNVHPDELQPIDMVNAVSGDRGAYIPSVAELAGLYTMICRHGFDKERWSHFLPMSGAYLTTSESAADTFYSFDFTQGAMSGHTSKRYTPLRLRLFYIF